MKLSPGLVNGKKKTTWKRLARQLRHKEEQRLASRKRIAEVLQAGSPSKVQWRRLFEVSNDSDSTPHIELAAIVQQPH